MNITQRHLALFDAIVRLQSLSKAADEQAISQSAASQSLKEMERQLGYALFQKVGRSLQITEAGQQALPRVRQILSHLDALPYPTDNFIGGRLVVSASETIGSYLLPSILADFVAQYPKVTPELAIHNSEGVVQDIEHGQARIGFIEGPAFSSQLSIQHWRSDELKVFCSPSFRWAEEGIIPDGELATAPWIVRESGSGTRAVFDQAFGQRQDVPRIRLSLSRQDAIKQSVRAGLGIGCLSELAIADEVSNHQLILLKTALKLTRPFSIIYAKQEVLSPLAQRFLEFAADWSKAKKG